MKQDPYEYEHYRLQKNGDADCWLKQNGITPDSLLTTDMVLLQAQRIAHNLLKHHAKLLDRNEVAALNNLLMKMSSSRQRKRLTKKDCYRGMNIGTAVNRKLFKNYRHTTPTH